MSKPNRKCVLFGHKEGDKDGGYNVCPRCGLSEYWDEMHYGPNNHEFRDSYQNENLIRGWLDGRIYDLKRWFKTIGKATKKKNRGLPF